MAADTGAASVSTARTAAAPAGDPGSLVVRSFVAIVVLLIPLRVLWLGWQPPDDALRHAAKAVTAREWAEILVLRPGVAPDSHPGWHAVLGSVHRWTGAAPPELVTLCVLGLALAVLLPGALLLRRPEAWLLALLVPALTDPSPIVRLEAGRPFLLSAALVVTFGLLSPRCPLGLSRRGFVAAALALGLVAWVHPSFYLFGLLPLACLLARRFRLAGQLALALALGIALAGILVGHPLRFVIESLGHPLLAFRDVPSLSLVAEFRPQIAPPAFWLACLALMGWRALRGRWTPAILVDPVFVLAVLGWVLGLAVRRFWSDWGFPAALVWLAFEFQDALVELCRSARGRLGLAAAASVPLLLAATTDYDGRFSARDRTFDCLAAAEQRRALPDPGGVLYSGEMRLFYALFYRLPEAPFRYVLGYEPGLMPPEDLGVYRRLQAGDAGAFREWADRMRPADRLVVVSPTGIAPPVAGLDWTLACGDVWSGRAQPAGSRR
jgi:hypothetical protein